MTGGGSATPARQAGPWANWVLTTLPYLSLLGLVSLVANIMLSFEEPHSERLLVSAMFLAAAPVGVLMHLAVTPELMRGEKRMWVAGLVGRNGPTYFAAYFSATERRRTTQVLDAARQDGRRPAHARARSDPGATRARERVTCMRTARLIVGCSVALVACQRANDAGTPLPALLVDTVHSQLGAAEGVSPPEYGLPPAAGFTVDATGFTFAVPPIVPKGVSAPNCIQVVRVRRPSTTSSGPSRCVGMRSLPRRRCLRTDQHPSVRS
jgi:hypothetical protein